ncbi:MAG TPA: hypothetical protein VIG50_10715 [Vicinamibacteria bacterium]|jgi:hypothetical protein
MSRTIAAALAFAALALLSACDSDSNRGPSTPTEPVPNLTGTYQGTNWLTQFQRTRDGYSGSWNCSGSMTLVQEPNSAKFSGFAVVGSPCPAVSFELTGSVTPGGSVTILTRGPRPGAGTCPLPPPSTYTGLFQGNTISARTQVKLDCPGDLEGEYTFNQIITARRF